MGEDIGKSDAAWVRAWAVTGVAGLFVLAVVRLGARGVWTIRAGLDGLEWAALAALTAAFVYGEGHRAIGRRWIPWMLERTDDVAGPEGGAVDRALAPIYAMGLVGGPRSTMVKAWAGVAAIVAAVLVVKAFPEPWRGITDFAVAAALAWATVVLVVRGAAGRARGDRPPGDGSGRDSSPTAGS